MKKEFDIKEIIEGAYYPGVYIIKIKKILNERIQYNDFKEEDWRTFIHEYVHFLQDISTSHGYIYYFHKSQMLNLAVYDIKNSSSDVIELPIQAEKTGIPNASEKQMLLDFYNGDHQYLKFHHINEVKIDYDEVVTKLVIDETDSNNKLFAVNIYYDEGKIYQFGNICILESMAYLIEYHLLEGEQRINEFPYNACEVICTHIYPEILKTPKKIMMLAEMALMHDDCGLFFLGLLDLCAKQHLAELDDKDFREFCIKNIDMSMENFEQYYKEAIEGIDRLFPVGFPYTGLTNMQLKIFLECGHNYRISNKLFIADTFDSPDCTEYFRRLIDLFGLPILIDGNDDYYGMEGTQYIPVADAVLNILTEKLGEGCSLQELCKKSKIGSYEKYRCTNEPWEQCKENEICPVAMYFKGYGIDYKKYKQRNH
ncbi:hypothetical protein [Pseudobutyrivibrio sp.]|uniref:hypothetical protein n=1 Tax=Pseudobutyrivibrio sp. TaxID=2014367 RepID=UPI001DD20B13|nr:hypothetical protein [Pseudobutyrivibrio sp.]MBE5912267.1 hypothetical protein [Pseudobutyrivibrio sp.]